MFTGSSNFTVTPFAGGKKLTTLFEVDGSSGRLVEASDAVREVEECWALKRKKMFQEYYVAHWCHRIIYRGPNVRDGESNCISLRIQCFDVLYIRM